MKILVTGAQGFVGKNLLAQLENIRTGRAAFPGLGEDLTVFPYDLDTEPAQLRTWCAECDFVIHLAGVNRPKDASEFHTGNCGFTETLLSALESSGSTAPVLLSSSIQAALLNPYGASKREAEELVLSHAEKTGAKAYVFRLPNVFGKWCRPNYNSAVATFCYNIARDLPITVNDPDVVLRLVYIDDVVDAFLSAAAGRVSMEDGFCTVQPVHTARLGGIVETLRRFRREETTLSAPHLSDAFERALYSTYLSSLPPERIVYRPLSHADGRGSFTELIRSEDGGQTSVNVTNPGITKGNHWHHTKVEKFITVSGEGLIRMRRVGADEVLSFPVSGREITVVHIPAGYAHSIANTGDTPLVTVMWCSECFDPARPDTYFEEV